MLRRTGLKAGAWLLSLLGAAACAVGVEIGEHRRDGGQDASRGTTSTGSTAGGDATLGAGGSTTTGGFTSGGGSLASGGAGAGGATSAGGGGATGGSSGGDAEHVDATPDVVDARVDGPVANDSGCGATQKSCGGRCVTPEARIGCGLVGCDPCSNPPNSLARCMGTQCDFSCLAGYVRSGDVCIAGEGGGTGGSSIDGGRCVASQCPDCVDLFALPCCRPDGRCGCQGFFSTTCQ